MKPLSGLLSLIKLCFHKISLVLEHFQNFASNYSPHMLIWITAWYWKDHFQRENKWQANSCSTECVLGVFLKSCYHSHVKCFKMTTGSSLLSIRNLCRIVENVFIPHSRKPHKIGLNYSKMVGYLSCLSQLHWDCMCVVYINMCTPVFTDLNVDILVGRGRLCF